MSAQLETVIRPADSAVGTPIPGMVTKNPSPVCINGVGGLGGLKTFNGQYTITVNYYDVKVPGEENGSQE